MEKPISCGSRMIAHPEYELFLFTFTDIYLSTILENDISTSSRDVSFHEIKIDEMFRMDPDKREIFK